MLTRYQYRKLFSKKLESLAASALLNRPSHLFSCIMVTRTLSETDCSKNRSLKLIAKSRLSGVKKSIQISVYFSMGMPKACFKELCID